jgi:SOS-response transcriptional repressor LexA
MLTRAFAFRVWDDRNAPEFQPGDRVVIDPTCKPAPGDMVFAIAGGDLIFARYTQPRTLNSLNAAWGEPPVDRIVGVMVDHAMPGRSPRGAAR